MCTRLNTLFLYWFGGYMIVCIDSIFLLVITSLHLPDCTHLIMPCTWIFHKYQGETCGVVHSRHEQENKTMCYTKVAQGWPMECKESEKATPLPDDYKSPPTPPKGSTITGNPIQFNSIQFKSRANFEWWQLNGPDFIMLELETINLSNE